MSFFKRMLGMTPSPPALRFPEENLLFTDSQADGFFVTSVGALLKDGRYKVIRKLGRGRCSNTFLVEDLQPTYV
jgi:serine/threonine-protein kinase SRPK3